jgi:hypothetical protein
MVKNLLKSALPHIIAIAVFALVAIIYCHPALEGKVLQQSDNIQWKGMSHSQQMETEATGKVPLWNNGMFGGMPGYLIMMPKLYNDVPYYFSQALTLGLPKPINFFVLACICFYILSIVAGANPFIGTLTALTYAFSTYNPIIVSVGHDTKMMAIALLPGVIAGVMLLFNKKYLAGVVLTSLFVGALITTKHYQIAYYTILIILFSSIAFAIKTIIEKDFKHLILVAALGISAGLLGVGSNIINLKTDAEYSALSIRGGSQLPAKGTGVINDKGLGKDYALSYSYQLMEPFVLMVPKLYGGSSDHLEIAEEKSKSIEALNLMQGGLGQQLQGYMQFYWGGIVEGTAGPAYAGVIILVLALISLFVIKKEQSIWIISLFAFTVLLSYGKYLTGFNYWMLDHLPIYNKFRAPSMISVVQIFLINFAALLGLKEMFSNYAEKNYMPALKKGLIATGLLFFMIIAFYLKSNFQGEVDKTLLKQVEQIKEPQIQSAIYQFTQALKEDRKTILLDSILRSMGFALLALLVVWAYIGKKLSFLNYKITLSALAFLCLVDLMGVNSKYLSSESFNEKENTSETILNAQAADIQIQNDKSDFRVLDLRSGNINAVFNGGAITAYFHKTIGGYHPAKLSLTQDLIENQLYNFPNCMPSVNMLNTKYIIDQQGRPIPNPDALGSAWFVKGIQYAKDPTAEMNALTTLNVKDTAVINMANQKSLSSITGNDSSASIKLVSKSNDVLQYQTNSKNTQLAVFSEIYYEKGWKAYIDNKETPILKANYLLRSLIIPAGSHTIKFEFKPDSYYGNIFYAQICQWLSILLILVLLGTWIKDFKAQQEKKLR